MRFVAVTTLKPKVDENGVIVRPLVWLAGAGAFVNPAHVVKVSPHVSGGTSLVLITDEELIVVEPAQEIAEALVEIDL